MKLEDIKITIGENAHQKAAIERNEKTIDYETSKNLSYTDIATIVRGLNVISEFFDVNAVVTASGAGICAVALGKSLEDAMLKVMDSNPVDFMNAIVLVSTEVDSEIAKMLKSSNKIAAPKFTKNAIEILERHDVCYVTINTPLKDYKNYLSNDIKVTPLGTLTQEPNLSELTKDSFKIMSKDAILASDMPVTIHDINVAAQGRIGLVILPSASADVITMVDKYNMALITTGITNILY